MCMFHLFMLDRLFLSRKGHPGHPQQKRLLQKKTCRNTPTTTSFPVTHFQMSGEYSLTITSYALIGVNLSQFTRNTCMSKISNQSILRSLDAQRETARNSKLAQKSCTKIKMNCHGILARDSSFPSSQPP